MRPSSAACGRCTRAPTYSSPRADSSRTATGRALDGGPGAAPAHDQGGRLPAEPRGRLAHLGRADGILPGHGHESPPCRLPARADRHGPPWADPRRPRGGRRSSLQSDSSRPRKTAWWSPWVHVRCPLIWGTQHFGVIASFHNHSDWSDGQTGFGAMYTSADRQRVDILGLSDHFCIFPDGTSPDWSIAPDRADEYVDEVVSYQGKGLMEVTVGAEFDWFENHGPILDPVLNALTLDYRIGSVHHVDRQQFDASPAFWQSKTEEERDAVFAKYWLLVRGMAESMLFDIASATLTCRRSSGFARRRWTWARRSTRRWTRSRGQRNGRGAQHGGVRAPVRRCLPVARHPCEVQGKGDPGDAFVGWAHPSAHPLRVRARGLARIHEAGYSSVARFRGREAWFEPLDNALRSERE